MSDFFLCLAYIALKNLQYVICVMQILTVLVGNLSLMIIVIVLGFLSDFRWD